MWLIHVHKRRCRRFSPTFRIVSQRGSLPTTVSATEGDLPGLRDRRSGKEIMDLTGLGWRPTDGAYSEREALFSERAFDVTVARLNSGLRASHSSAWVSSSPEEIERRRGKRLAKGRSLELLGSWRDEAGRRRYFARLYNTECPILSDIQDVLTLLLWG